MPAFNEEGLPEFLSELDAHLTPVVASLTFVVVDDLSETPVVELLSADVLSATSHVCIVRNQENLGHGPSALRAFAALRSLRLRASSRGGSTPPSLASPQLQL